MEWTITPAQMKALETDFMRKTGMPGALLMEHAAQGVAAAMARHARGERALILCGPGNNGGDGYAAARLWQATGHAATVLELTDKAQGDALLNRCLAADAGVVIRTLDRAPDTLPACDVIVDALFGTGLSRAPEGTAAALIRLANASGVPIVAVDVPSGLCGETGRALGETICAAETVTFHRIKTGLLLRQAPAYTGALTVHPILIPAVFGAQDGLSCMTPADLPRLIRPRAFDAHKGSFGRVVIFAGSEGMAGAAAFAAQACVKAGAGLTTVLCRAAVLPIVQVLAPGATCRVLPEQNGRLTAEAAAIAADALRSASAAAIGCGLGTAGGVLPVLAAFREAACPVVWDADALNLLAAHRTLLPLPEGHVVTPHPGEAARLLGCTTREITDAPLAALDRLQMLCGCHVLLKGARTLMRDSSQRAINRFGSPAMAKGGSGDVLTGVMAALLARPIPCASTLEKVQLAALVHGLAGLRAAQAAGENCVTPQALIGAIRLDR